MEWIVARLLGSACLTAGASGFFGAKEALAREGLPEGVIEPYDWGSRRIPISDFGADGTAVLDEAITAAMRQYGIVGCGICVIRGAQIVYSRGFGYSELPQTPFTASTASRCGSLAKPITSLCALALLDEGKLNLDAEILPILREAGIVPKPVGSTQIDDRIARIKVRHLMDHTSGLPSGATYTAWRPGRNVAAIHNLDHIPTSADVASDALGNFSLDFEPGAKYQYANANFVLLARVIEAAAKTPFNTFLTTTAMPRFGLNAADVYVSRNQTRMNDPARGKNEAAYYQTSAERYVSFVPSEQSQGENSGSVYGEAYRGYATEAADGGGGIACTAHAIGKIIANLHSAQPAISARAIREILDPPAHYTHESGFDPTRSEYYSKGFNVRYSGGRPWVSHGGMTNHCGGVIGHNAGYQFVAVSNWNNAREPYVDAILSHALGEAVGKLAGHA
jgi:CubicO group peptidase (beta-lactamase class C family)